MLPAPLRDEPANASRRRSGSSSSVTISTSAPFSTSNSMSPSSIPAQYPKLLSLIRRDPLALGLQPLGGISGTITVDNHFFALFNSSFLRHGPYLSLPYSRFVLSNQNLFTALIRFLFFCAFCRRWATSFRCFLARSAGGQTVLTDLLKSQVAACSALPLLPGLFRTGAPAQPFRVASSDPSGRLPISTLPKS